MIKIVAGSRVYQSAHMLCLFNDLCPHLKPVQGASDESSSFTINAQKMKELILTLISQISPPSYLSSVRFKGSDGCMPNTVLLFPSLKGARSFREILYDQGIRLHL